MRKTRDLVAHSQDDKVAGVVPECLPNPRAYRRAYPTPSGAARGATTGGLPLQDHLIQRQKN
jgi:hypothetical protein